MADVYLALCSSAGRVKAPPAASHVFARCAAAAALTGQGSAQVVHKHALGGGRVLQRRVWGKYSRGAGTEISDTASSFADSAPLY